MVWDLRLRVWGLGRKVWGVWSGLWLRIWGLGLRVQGLGRTYLWSLFGVKSGFGAALQWRKGTKIINLLIYVDSYEP